MHLKYHEVLDIFMKRLPLAGNGDEGFRANAELFFWACIDVLRFRGVEHVCGHCEAVHGLNKIEFGYGRSLQDVNTANELAENDFPPHYGSFYHKFVGASEMAQAYLLNLGRMEKISGHDLIDFMKKT